MCNPQQWAYGQGMIEWLDGHLSPIPPSWRIPFASCHLESCLCHLTCQGMTTLGLQWTTLPVSTIAHLWECFLPGLDNCICVQRLFVSLSAVRLMGSHGCFQFQGSHKDGCRIGICSSFSKTVRLCLRICKWTTFRFPLLKLWDYLKYMSVFFELMNESLGYVTAKVFI